MSVLFVVLSLFVVSLVLWAVAPEGAVKFHARQFAKGFMLSIYFSFVAWAFILYLPLLILECAECNDEVHPEYDPEYRAYDHFKSVLKDRFDGCERAFEWCFTTVIG